ncbi:MAG: glycosyltransferase [[Clostridium] cellulosi]
MKVLILTTSTGQGHNAAASAISEGLNALGCETEILDVLSVGKRNISPHISSLYSNIVNHTPLLFSALYNMGAVVSSSKRHSPIYYLNSLYSSSLERKLNESMPDVIVCTHIFGAQAFTYLYNKNRIRIPSVAIMTDYTCSPFWEETKADKFVIPSPLLIDEFAEKGIPKEKIVPIGIPVRTKYIHKTEKAVARKKLNLPLDKTVFFCMGGSTGFGNIKKLCVELKKVKPDCIITAVCGHNEKLYRKLCEYPSVKAYNFSDDVDILMDAADVVLTKPGGLTISEAASKRIPLILTAPIPGAETMNAAFFEKCGMAISAKNIKDAAAAAKKITEDENLSNMLISAQQKYISTDTSKRIAELVVETAGQAGTFGEE